ncbi:3-oxo-5-alpha-steroid 4-dehydrogenase 2 isoform X3 [Elgaria multicarinata webbii]|uniref:3-oxo-5-alpha-steroid 4-dehydrogenase 2 isoform X3 n=1 Tax=Elgaria multicarinata webbii TaxID=159646 RepID=UPI002FCD0B4F
MQCSPSLVAALSSLLLAVGLLQLWRNRHRPIGYGKHENQQQRKPHEEEGGKDGAEKPPLPLPRRGHLPARCAWFLQELPAFLVPALLLALRSPPRLAPLGCRLLGGMFCGHYFHRTFIYSFFTRGIVLFLFGMGINIHSDILLRQLRKPGELTYKIPQGGLFAYVSGANFFGEILEWFGYAVATWSLPAFSFALFTLCCIGPRAYHHHRYYLRKFTSYPKSRRALIPFIF